jgi:lipopolysaccharide export system protein LptA
MKSFVHLLILVLGLAMAGRVAATTNDLQKLSIQSPNGGSFDMVHFRTIYNGPVTVDDPRMHLTSDWLAADLPHDKVTDSHVVAATNVVMVLIDDKGQTNHATSDLAVYNMHVAAGVTNETVTLSGHAKMWSDKVNITGEPLIWDLLKQELTSTNWQTTFTHSMLDSLAGTNSTGHKTNSVLPLPGL